MKAGKGTFPRHLALYAAAPRARAVLAPSLGLLREAADFLFRLTPLEILSFQDAAVEESLREGDKSAAALVSAFLSPENLPAGVRPLLRGDPLLLGRGTPPAAAAAMKALPPAPGEKALIWFVGYGARSEIVRAAAEMSSERGKEPTREAFEEHLLTAGIPDPDLYIITGRRPVLPDFLAYQISYSELYLSGKDWTDMTPGDLMAALESYSRRDRRYGRV